MQKPVKWAMTAAMVLALGGVGYALYVQTGASMTYYYEANEVDPARFIGERIKLSGIVLADSISRDPATLRTDFTIDGGVRKHRVSYTGPVPDIFGPGIQVVVTGAFTESGLFVGDELLAKCPSKYQAEGSREDFKHLNGYQIEYQPATTSISGS